MSDRLRTALARIAQAVPVVIGVVVISFLLARCPATRRSTSPALPQTKLLLNKSV